MKMKKFLSSLTVLAFALCLVSSAAYAAPADTEPAPTDMPAPSAALLPADGGVLVINAEGETLYNDGDTVFNNFGTVYNNGGVVYNNGGTVYNNSGTVYNNGGTVYNNGALVYNNNGTVYNNGAGDAAALPAMAETAEAADKGFEISFAADYSALCDIEGLRDIDGKSYIDSGGAAVIKAKPGLALVSATTDTGACSIDGQGVVTLDRVDRDGTLTLAFAVAPPVISPEGGSFAAAHEVSLECEAEGAVIYYTTDGSEPGEKSSRYEEPFEVDESCVVRAAAWLEGAEHSEPVEASFVYPSVNKLSFADETEGYLDVDAKAVVVKNTGLGTLKIERAELAGEDKDAFTLISGSGASIASGQSNARSWKVEPKKGLAAGEYKAELVFTLSSGDTAAAEIEFRVLKSSGKKA